MRVLVPFDATTPKTRLEPMLEGSERQAFARAMLRDVLESLRVAGATPTVVATEPIDLERSSLRDVAVVVDERPLTPAINERLARTEPPLAIVVADLGLVTPRAIERLFETAGDVVIVPGRGGGTNALVVREPGFRVDYHGLSCEDHRRVAADLGAQTATVDSYRLSTDIDEPEDLPEVLLHASGAARAWLESAGFEVDVTNSRVGVRRSRSPSVPDWG